MMKVYLEPFFRGVDAGDGGIRQVVTAQRRYLPEFGIDVVDTLEEADLVATHAGNTPNVPTSVPWVVHTHGLYWEGYEWPLWAKKLNGQVIDAMRRADHVTAPSSWVADVLRRGMWLSPTVLYHGVDPERWDGGSDRGYVLWNKTRVDPICDPEPVNELARRGRDLTFMTTFGDALPNVQVTGRLPFEDAADLVRHAGAYLCTTRETMGIGTLEAMAAGVPVVGWAWGGQAEIIRHRETGWLARPGDFDGLLEGVRWALANRREVGEAARADVLARFTWREAVGWYASLYENVLKQHRQQWSPETPRVSVVVPAYNLAQYLPDTLRSLQAQTDADWEAIVVDDASPDATGSVVAEFVAADPRIRYVRNERNLYLAGALNVGLRAARGRYLLNLDADNMLAPDALATLADALDADRGTHIAYGAVKFVEDDGRTPDRKVSVDGVSAWPPAVFRFSDQIQRRNQIPSTAMMRRSVPERLGGWRTRCRTAEDAEFWTRAASYGAVPRKVTDGVTLVYRQRAGSMSRVEPEWDWTGWLPWSRQRALVPFGAAGLPPGEGQFSWPVPTYEPAKVTVIIPVGPAHAATVIDALDSVEAQTFRQWECIVVNDTGGPLPFVPPWATVLTTSNSGGQGPAAARNRGIAASRAPLLLFLDADDYLQPDALTSLVAVQAERGGVVYSQWWDDFDNKSEVYDPPEYDAHLLTRKGCIHAVTALYPKAAVVAAGGFDERLSHWEDWDLQLQLAAAGVCGTKIPRPLWTYRKHTGLRREDNAATFEAGKAAILAKWSRLWEGRDTLMGCSSCPGGGGRNAPMPPSPSNGSGLPADAPQGAVLMEFIGASVGSQTYLGKVTGTTYRFGNNNSHRQRYVHAADVPALLTLKDRFRIVTALPTGGAASPRIEVLGPPERRPSPVPPEERVSPDVTHGQARIIGGNVTANVPTPARPAAPAPVADVGTITLYHGGLSYKQVRDRVPSASETELAAALELENASAAPRVNVVKLLESELTARREASEKELVTA